MCEMAGADYEKINFKEYNWFYKYEWTVKQEEEFRNWLEKELYKSCKMRKEMMRYPSKDKNYIKKFVDYFIFDCGWK